MTARADPTTAPPRLPVLSSANAAYFPGLLVTFHSLLRHLGQPWAADFRLLTDDLDERRLETLHRVLRSTGRDYTLEVIRPDIGVYGDLPGLRGSRLTYERLRVQRLVAGERVLYVDSDVVVTRDVSRLAALPFSGESVLHAVNDARIPVVSHVYERLPLGELGIPADTPYFNSGLLWIDLEAWRRQGIEDACFEYIARYPDRLALHEQSALNAVLWRRWTPLEKAWNLAPEDLMAPLVPYPLFRRRDVNVHYIGREKPWREMHPLEYFYWEQAGEVARLVPGEFKPRSQIARQTRKRVQYFATRAYRRYRKFGKRVLLNCAGWNF